MYLSERGRCLGHCVCLIRCETSTCCFRLTMCDEVLMLLSHECCELWTKITWKYSSHFLFVLYFTELYVFLQWFSLSASSPSHSVKVNIEDSKCFIRGEKDASRESNKDRRSDRQRRRRAELNICADLRAAEGSVLFCWDDGGPVLHLSQLLLLTCGSWSWVLTRSPHSVDLEIIPTNIPPWRHTPEPTASVKLTLFSINPDVSAGWVSSFLLALCLSAGVYCIRQRGRKTITVHSERAALHGCRRLSAFNRRKKKTHWKRWTHTEVCTEGVMQDIQKKEVEKEIKHDGR